MKRSVGQLLWAATEVRERVQDSQKRPCNLPGALSALPSAGLGWSLCVALILFQQRCLGHVGRTVAIRRPDLEIPIGEKKKSTKERKRASFLHF